MEGIKQKKQVSLSSPHFFICMSFQTLPFIIQVHMCILCVFIFCKNGIDPTEGEIFRSKSPKSASQILMCTQIPWRWCKNADSDLAGLGGGPGAAEVSSLRPALGAAMPQTTDFQTGFLGFPEDASGAGLGVAQSGFNKISLVKKGVFML